MRGGCLKIQKGEMVWSLEGTRKRLICSQCRCSAKSWRQGRKCKEDMGHESLLYYCMFACLKNTEKIWDVWKWKMAQSILTFLWGYIVTKKITRGSQLFIEKPAWSVRGTVVIPLCKCVYCWREDWYRWRLESGIPVLRYSQNCSWDEWKNGLTHWQ